MAFVRLSHQARDELNAIIDYYVRVGAIGFAEVFEESVLDKIRSLKQYPRMGRKLPEVDDDSIREVLYRNYRIVYHVDENDEEVILLTVFHSSKEIGRTRTGE